MSSMRGMCMLFSLAFAAGFGFAVRLYQFHTHHAHHHPLRTAPEVRHPAQGGRVCSRIRVLGSRRQTDIVQWTEACMDSTGVFDGRTSTLGQTTGTPDTATLTHALDTNAASTSRRRLSHTIIGTRPPYEAVVPRRRCRCPSHLPRRLPRRRHRRVHRCCRRFRRWRRSNRATP
jgi:hypothetical protein